MAVTLYSTQLTTLNAKLAGSGAALEPHELGGRLRIAKFEAAVAAGVLSGVTYGLVRLPKGAVIYDLVYQVTATTGSTTLAFGLEDVDGGSTYTSTTAIKSAAVLTTAGAAGQLRAGFLSTTGAIPTPLSEEVLVTMTTGAATAVTGWTVSGFVIYVDKMG